MKTCSACTVSKSLTDFTKRNRRNQTHSHRCKACDKLWWEQNRERVLVTRREFYHSNKEASIIRTRNNWERRLLKTAKGRAKRKNLAFTLVLSDIVIPDKCPYLKVELTRELGQGQVLTNASIDRIDSTKGYTPDNIRVISYLANTMKNNATKEQLSIFAKNVLKMHPITKGD